MLTFARLHLLVFFVGFCLVQGAPVGLNDDQVTHLRRQEDSSDIVRRNPPSRLGPAMRKFRAATKLAKGPHVFWSGKDGAGKSIKDTAEKHAEKVGGNTLYANVKAAGVKPPAGHLAKPAVKKWWETVSAIKAKEAKGNAHAVLGKTTKKDSVWNRIELPALQKNKKVPEVHQIDPETGDTVKKLKP